MTRKDIPNTGAPNFLERVREEIQTYLGRRGDPLDRGLTLRDLLESGVVKLRYGNGGGSTIPLEPGDGVVTPPAPVDEPDLTPPPTPSGLTATPAISHILVGHDPAMYVVGGGHLRTRLYAVQRLTGDPAPVFSDAVEVAQFSGDLYAFPVNPSTTWHFWAKWETRDGVLSASPAGGTNGVSATSGLDVTSLLEALQGEITSSELATALASRIDLIDAPTTGLVTRLSQAESELSTLVVEVADLSSTPTYDALTTYQVDDLVQYNGGLYRAIATTTGNLPTTTAYWQKVGDYTSLSAVVSGHSADISDLDTRVTSTESGLVAEASNRNVLAAQIRGSYTGTDLTQVSSGLIASERTARVSADSAQVTRISALESTVNNPTTGVTATATAVSSLQTTVSSQGSTLSAQASQITTLQSSVASNTSAISTEATTRASETGSLFAQYTVKLDTNGYVSGFGLANTGTTANPFSDFQVRADRFSITNPAATQATITSLTRSTTVATLDTSAAHGLVVGDSFSIRGVENDVNWNRTFVVLSVPSTTRITFTVPSTLATPATGTTRRVAKTVVPFIVSNGVVYLDKAAIKDGDIDNAKIANLAVDNAKIADLSVVKLTGSAMGVGAYIASTNYVSGSAGWRINADGTAEFSGVVVRGTVYASAGVIGGSTLGSTFIQSTNYVGDDAGWRLNSDGTGQIGGFRVINNGIQSTNFSAGSAGWRLLRDGTFEANTGTFRGAVQGSQFTTGAMTGYAWPPAGQYGTYLGPSGLLIGNSANSKYFQVTADGNIYAPGFNVVNGTLTISQANVINTLQLAGNAVTIPSSSRTTANTTLQLTQQQMLSITVNAQDQPIFVIATGVILRGAAQNSTSEGAAHLYVDGVAYSSTGQIDGSFAISAMINSPGTHTFALFANTIVISGLNARSTLLAGANIFAIGVKR